MRAPGFWYRPKRWAAMLLAPAAWVWGRVAARRMAEPGVTAAVPVICVGNPTAGGVGKTPTALALAARLKARGEVPFFLTRGHGGTLGRVAPVRVGAEHGATEVGDEALLLTRDAPTVVARDRAAGAALAVAGGASVIVMDDGFQNPGLVKDLSVLLIDGATGIGNGMVHPAGPLRAPYEAQVARAGAVLLVGPGEPGEVVAAQTQRLKPAIAVLRGAITPDPLMARALDGVRVLAFAGIGRPEKFFATLRAVGAEVVEAFPFADHHRYTESDAKRLLAFARAKRLLPVTTAKDHVKLAGGASLAALAREATVLPVTVTFEGDAVDRLVDAVLTARRG